MRIFLLLFACMIAFADPTVAAEFTVDDDGGYDFTSIEACVIAADDGDTCEVRDGSYSGFTWSNSGSQDLWISVVAATGHAPEITSIIRLDDVHYLRLEGLTLPAIRTASYTGPKCNHINIINNAFSGDGYDGIAVNLRGDDVMISGNSFDQYGHDFIRHFGERWVIRNNTVIDETEAAPDHMDFWQTFCGGAAPDELVASYGLIENNLWIDVSGSNAHFMVGNATSGCGLPITNMIVRHNILARAGSRFIIIDDNEQDPGTSRNVIYNNTFYRLFSDTTVPTWLDYITMNGSTHSSGINNIFYRATDYANVRGFLWAAEGEQSYNHYYDPDHVMTFSSPASTETGALKNIDPLLADPDNNVFSLGAGSRVVDSGGPLTFVAVGDAESGEILAVEKAEFFQPGWGGADGDWIAVGSADNIAQITAINYDTHTITLAASITRSEGEPVYLFRDSDGTRVLYGERPDMGAVEQGSTGSGDDPGGSDTPPESDSSSGSGWCFIRTAVDER